MLSCVTLMCTVHRPCFYRPCVQPTCRCGRPPRCCIHPLKTWSLLSDQLADLHCWDWWWLWSQGHSHCHAHWCQIPQAEAIAGQGPGAQWYHKEAQLWPRLCKFLCPTWIVAAGLKGGGKDWWQRLRRETVVWRAEKQQWEDVGDIQEVVWIVRDRRGSNCSCRNVLQTNGKS